MDSQIVTHLLSFSTNTIINILIILFFVNIISISCIFYLIKLNNSLVNDLIENFDTLYDNMEKCYSNIHNLMSLTVELNSIYIEQLDVKLPSTTKNKINKFLLQNDDDST